MMLLTHALFALICSILAARMLNITDSIIFVAAAVILSILVDIDNIRSSVGQKLEPYARALNFLFRHRGLLHSVWIPLALFLLLANLNMTIALGIAVGYGSHLLIDAITIEGIMPFYPIKHKFRGFVRVGGITEQLIVIAMFALMAALSTGQL